MEGRVWRVSKKKYGVAICKYDGDSEGTLGLSVGETVHIFEEYGSGRTGWYRGTSFKNKDKMGIFPACLIHIKKCEVDNEGLYETVIPVEDIMVKEVSYVLREWSTMWKEHYVKSSRVFNSISHSMEELCTLRGLLVDKKLTNEDISDVKTHIVGVIDWGNGQLKMDLVPRINGEQVEADKCSITRLYRVHLDSAHIANAAKPKQRRHLSSNKSDLMTEAGITTHHLLTSFKNFGCNVGDTTETLLSLFQYRENKCVCLTEKFLVRHTSKSVPEDLDKLGNYFGLFTDLTSDDLERDLYLVAQIYRIGKMKDEHSTKKVKTVTYRRPWGVGVVGLNLGRLPANIKEYEFQMKVICCDDNENTFPTSHEHQIKRLIAGGSNVIGTSANKLGLCLTVSAKTLHGDLATVKKEDPMLFSKGVALIQKLGFSEIITPGEVRNDFYVTLRSAELFRGKKKAQRNIEVRVTVYNAAGQQIKDCITKGCGEPAKSEYLTAVYYHNNRPEWDETIRISVPIDIFPGSHIFFELFHCSVSSSTKDTKKPNGFAFVRITNKAQIVIRDDTHELCVYKLEDKDKSHFDMTKYMDLPCLTDDLNDPHHINRVPSHLKHLVFKSNERETLTISTLLCSGKFTQNGDLLGILNWRGEQFQGKLEENLDKLSKMQGEEIVKFLHDILDALFDIFSEERETKEHNHKVFQTMVNIFTLIHHARFETFKPVLEAYITDTFSAPLVHEALCLCFGEMIQKACRLEGKTNMQLIQVFQAVDYIFRFVVQSRQLQIKHIYGGGTDMAHEFHTNLRKLFQSFGILLSSKSDKLKPYQVALLGSLHKSYPPLMKVLSEKDLALLLKLCLSHMQEASEVPEDITRVKIELLRTTVNSTLFTNDESRSELLPLCLDELKFCLSRKILLKLTIELLADIMTETFKLKQKIVIKEDIQNIVSTMFDVVMETILSLSHSPSATKKPNNTKIRKRPSRSRTHTGYTMKNEANLSHMRKKRNRLMSTSHLETPTFVPTITVETVPAEETCDEEHYCAAESSNRERRPSDQRTFRTVTGFFDRLPWSSSRDKDYLNLEGQGSKSRSRSSSPSKSDHSQDSDSNVVLSRPSVEEQTNHPRHIHGAVISCLIEMLRLMDEEHYDNLLHVYHRGQPLKSFLVSILTVFKLLVQPEVFPDDWTVMRMVTNNVVFTAVEYFCQALKDNYITDEKFDQQLWKNYFNLAVAFITQPSLQLDKFSHAKAQKLKERYQDLRVLMGIQVQTLWHSLGRHKEHFIPGMIGPFLELTLVREKEVRKATLPIIFDMLESDQRLHGNFKQVEATLIERLDYFLTLRYGGDSQYKDLFREILLERVQSEPTLQENGTQFILSVTHLLERLLDYRQVVDGDENRDKRMHCTFNILNFYKDEINREEMYIRYVNKLHELHVVANNHAEAGLTLQLYAKVLTWSDNMLLAEMRYKQELEKDRKEMLYTQVINCFDKGKVWEYALPLCKELAEYYEKKLDYKKLGDILKQQASFYQKILEGVPGEDPSQPDAFFPRQDPSYYKVAYFGQSFPAFVRNKQFVYRGDECLKLETIMNHLTAEFPSAHIIPAKNKDESLKSGEQQYIQICSVKPIPSERPEFHNKDVPLEIQSFYNVNEVDTFQSDRPYHRGTVDKENETKTLCLERTKIKTAYKFPGILRWHEVVEITVDMLSPIRVAEDTVKQYNIEFQTLLTRCQANPKLYFNQLEMRLQGMIQAAVGGGIKKYHEAFFTRKFETKYPDEVIYLDDLKARLSEQVNILARGMSLHEKLVPQDLVPLHKSLEKEFIKMRKSVHEHSSPHSSIGSMTSLVSVSSIGRPGTPGSGSQSSSSGRSSTYSQDGEDPLFTSMPSLDKSRRSFHPFPDDDKVPPPIPSRPQSMHLSGHMMSQMSIPPRILHSSSDPILPEGPADRTNKQNLKQVQRCETFSGKDLPHLPEKRRPSDRERRSHTDMTSHVTSPVTTQIPTISTSPPEFGSIKEDGPPPSLPEKRGTQIMSNGSYLNRKPAYSPSSPINESRLSPASNGSPSPKVQVPALPPRKQSPATHHPQVYSRNVSEPGPDTPPPHPPHRNSSMSTMTTASSIHTPVIHNISEHPSPTQHHTGDGPPPIPRRMDTRKS